MQALVDGHADPDLVDRDDRTSLHVAALNGHASVVQVNAGRVKKEGLVQTEGDCRYLLGGNTHTRGGMRYT